MDKSVEREFPIVVLTIISLAALITVTSEVAAQEGLWLYIKPDGSVTYNVVNGHVPAVKREGDLYTLTGSSGNIVIQRSNIVLDGDGYDVIGGALKLGINVSNVVNVTIRNIQFKMAEIGIYFEQSSFNSVLNNTFSSYADFYPYYLHHGITINSSSHDNLVENNSFSYCDFGVLLEGNCYNTNISKNNFVDSYTAISVESNSDYTRIANNSIMTSNQGLRDFWSTRGIFVSGASNCEILDSSFAKLGVGIDLDSSGGNKITGNFFEQSGLKVDYSSSNNVVNNTVNGKPLVYLENVADRSIEKAGQVILVDCRNITMANLNLSYSTIGVELWNTNSSRLTNSTIIDNTWRGVFLSHSANNILTNNSIEEHRQFGQFGVFLEYSNGNNVTNNLISENQAGFVFINSSQNFAYHNSIFNNTYLGGSAYSNNSWDNGYPSGGNFWGENYTGTDIRRGPFQNETGRDGIGDTIYAIFENQDNYPLMNPWHDPPWIPYAFFNYSHIEPRIDETITFDAWNSYDFDGQIINYLWDFGDGTFTNETGSLTNHTFTFPRVYNVALTVVDNEGLNGTTEKNISLIKISSNISISASPSAPALGQNTTLGGQVFPKRPQTNVSIWVRSGNAWVIIANVTSDEDSNYSSVWTPPAMGFYSIKANWTGDDYTFPSESAPLIVTCTRIPTSISILTNYSSTLNGFKVEVKGTLLDIYSGRLKGETIVLSYTFAGIGIWTPITSDSTDDLGEYRIVWFPPATGNYLLKAEWSGNSSYFGVSNTIAVSTIPYENQYVFTVESNSTVSDLIFDQNSGKLSFGVSGLYGTTGYTRVTIAKSIIMDVTKIKIRVDGLEYNYTVTELNDSWILLFTYNHSTRQVEVDLQDAIPEFPSVLAWVLLALTTTIVAICRVKRKRILS